MNSWEVSEMPRFKKPMRAHVVTLDPEAIKKAQQWPSDMPFDITKVETKTIATWVAPWIEHIYGAKMPGRDPLAPFVVQNEGGLFQQITARCFNSKTIRIQQASRSGAKRDEQSTRQDMISDILNSAFFVFVDCRQLPQITLYPVPSQMLLHLVITDDIPKSGISTTKFDQFLRNNFEIERKPYDPTPAGRGDAGPISLVQHDRRS